MHRNEWRMALRTVPFLDSHAADPAGLLELRSPPEQRLLIWHPEAIDWVFHQDRQVGHVPSRSLAPVLGRRSLLWIDGPRHSAYRRVIGPLLRGHHLHDYREIVSGVVRAGLAGYPPGSVLPLAEWTRSVTLRVISRILFGQSEDVPLAEFTGWIHRALGRRPRTLYYRYLAGGLPASGPALDRRFVRAAREAADSTLAGALLAGGEPLGSLDDGELRDQVVSLLFAGHETTASATAWALYWLDRNPDVRRDVRAELDATGTDGFEATPLLHAVVSETLRLSPPAPVAGNRVLRTDAELLGCPLAAGTVLTPSIYLAHHSPDRFPDPYRFDPGRFLGERVPAQRYLPFGGGTRHCLGADLAAMEIRMIVAAMLRERELRCLNPGAGRAALRGHAMAPSGRLRMAVT